MGKLILMLGVLGLGSGLLFNSFTRKQDQPPTDGRFVKSQTVEQLFKWVPEELRGGVFRPSEPNDRVEGFYYARNVRLKHALSDWTQLEFYHNETKISQVRIFGFTQVNGGKQLDVSIEDEKLIDDIKKAIDCSSVFRPCVSDLGNGGNRAHGAMILGVIQIKFDGDRLPIIIGVSPKAFSLGACYGPSSQWFFAPRLTKVLDNILKQNTESQSGLPAKVINNLQGKRYFD